MKFRMRFSILAAAAIATAGAGAWCRPAAEIVIQADVGRIEIERILAADNLDTAGLPPRDVASRMAAIRKGRAPDDFWRAYQRHVDAWHRLAEASDSLARDDDELIAAGHWVNSSFDEVERLARRYRARLPQPRTRAAPAS